MALRVGYDIALQLGADIVVTLDADGQHLPEEIPMLIEPIVEDRADHVNGSRMLGDFERGGGFVRHAGRALLLRGSSRSSPVSASPTSRAVIARRAPRPCAS